MKYIIIIPLLITTFALWSCDNEKKKYSTDKWEVRRMKQKLLDSLNSNDAYTLAKQHNAIIGWDSTDNFTYVLQDVVEYDSRPISFIGHIKDIIRKDSLYVLKVVNTNYLARKNFIAEITVVASQFENIMHKISADEYNEGCFIFKAQKFSSYTPILASEIEPDGQNVDDASSYLTFDFNESLIKLEGTLINFFIFRNDLN